MKEQILKILEEGKKYGYSNEAVAGELLNVIGGSSRTLTGLFIHYDNGDMVNIQDLPKQEYEEFLEQMNALRMAYITLVVSRQ